MRPCGGPAHPGRPAACSAAAQLAGLSGGAGAAAALTGLSRSRASSPAGMAPAPRRAPLLQGLVPIRGESAALRAVRRPRRLRSGADRRRSAFPAPPGMLRPGGSGAMLARGANTKRPASAASASRTRVRPSSAAAARRRAAPARTPAPIRRPARTRLHTAPGASRRSIRTLRQQRTRGRSVRGDAPAQVTAARRSARNRARNARRSSSAGGAYSSSERPRPARPRRPGPALRIVTPSRGRTISPASSTAAMRATVSPSTVPPW